MYEKRCIFYVKNKRRLYLDKIMGYLPGLPAPYGPLTVIGVYSIVSDNQGFCRRTPWEKRYFRQGEKPWLRPVKTPVLPARPRNSFVPAAAKSK
jgi:hypothetical protein